MPGKRSDLLFSFLHILFLLLLCSFYSSYPSPSFISSFFSTASSTFSLVLILSYSSSVISTSFHLKILLPHRYISSHQVACRDHSMHSMGGVSLEISLAIITAVAIFMLVSCVLLSRLCHGMDSALLARARLMVFHPDHDKQLLSQVYDSIQLNTDDISAEAGAVLAHPASAAALADGKASTALTEIRPRPSTSTSQEVAVSEVQLHATDQKPKYTPVADEDSLA